MQRSAGTAAGARAPATVERGAARRLGLRLAVTAAGGVAILAALIVLAYALAAARVPEHRLALEELVRAQTGLDLRFSELGLRWGWYGPEAVFRGVELREPGAAGELLQAPELVVGFDLWRMLRSGAPEAGRITLVDPDIDLVRRPSAAGAAAAAPPDGLRLLARWRGTRFEIEGGRLRVAAAGPAAAPITVFIRNVSLRRTAAEWSAEARVLLPESLGAAARATLAMSGDPAIPASLGGTLELRGERLELAGWRAALPSVAAAYLPRAGTGTLLLRAKFAAGHLVSADGRVRAEALRWPALPPDSGGLALSELRGEWRLARTAAGWHLAVDPLELPGAGTAGAALSLEAGGDGSSLRGRIERAPIATLAALVRAVAPQLPLAALELGGMVREASFDFDARRPLAERLRTAAELDGLTLASRDGALRIGGLGAHLSSAGRRVHVALHAHDARLMRPASTVPASFAVSAQLELEDSAHGWRLGTRDLEIRRNEARLVASGTLSGASAISPPYLDARLSVSGADVARVRELLGTDTLASLGEWAASLTAGRIAHAQLEARGLLDRPLPWSGVRRRFRGRLELRDASLTGAGPRPDIHGLNARLDWNGARVTALIDGAAVGSFRLGAARGQWDARAAQLTQLSGRLAGNAEEALAWLRGHPQLAQYLPGAEGLDLRGETLINFAARRDAAAPDGSSARRFRARVTAALDGVQLRPVAGLPAIEALHGTIAFADGRLQRSTLTGAWLGGPLALQVGERREHGGAALGISARGLLSVPEALLAAGVSSAGSPVQGSAEWSAQLSLLPATGGQAPDWSAHADSDLIGVASELPEPFAKPAAGALALHLELAGSGDSGELRVSLGERLRGVLALRRRGALWQIERAAVSLAAIEPVLPSEPTVRFEGVVTRLDLAGYALLWRELVGNPAWPALHAHLATAQLRVAGIDFARAELEADAGAGTDELRVESAALAGIVRWPRAADASSSVDLTRLDLPRLADASAAADLGALLAPRARVSVAELSWRGRPLGAFSAEVAAGGGALGLSAAQLSGTDAEARGRLECRATRCTAQFSLESRDPAALLASLGLRADVAARRGVVSGQLEWSPQVPAVLATANGRLHIELDDGVVRSAAAPGGAPGARLGLLAIPALLAGMGSPQLAFARLGGDFALQDGAATTSNLHFDGDAELLLEGRIGLLERTYDARVRVLKGEERLPALVRGFARGTRVAAAWLALRELLAGGGRDRAALRLRGTWDDPMVTAAD